MIQLNRVVKASSTFEISVCSLIILFELFMMFCVVSLIFSISTTFLTSLPSVCILSITHHISDSTFFFLSQSLFISITSFGSNFIFHNAISMIDETSFDKFNSVLTFSISTIGELNISLTLGVML